MQWIRNMIAERATKSARSDAIDAALKAKYHRELTKCGAVNYVVAPRPLQNQRSKHQKTSMGWLSFAEKEFDPQGFAGSRDRAFIAG